MIRAARPEDAGAIAAIYAPYVLDGTISFEDVPPDPIAMAERMAAGDGLYPWLVARADGAVAGYAYASAWSPRSAYRWTVETTVYVAPHAHGRGLGRALYGALLTTLTAQGFHQAIGRISLPNPPSIALHQALGFHRTALMPAMGHKAGRWIDVECWQRMLAERATQPTEPQRWDATTAPI